MITWNIDDFKGGGGGGGYYFINLGLKATTLEVKYPRSCAQLSEGPSVIPSLQGGWPNSPSGRL